MNEDRENASAEAPGEAPPKRKRRRRKDARPSEIIEAGLAEFAEKGFAAARLDDIAKRADISKATIYLYFENKEALFAAATQTSSVQLLDQIEATIDAYEGSTIDLLKTMIRMAYQGMLYTNAARVARIIITEGPHAPVLVQHHHREVVSKGEAMLRKVVARGVSRGELRDGPFAREPRIMIAPVMMAVLWRILFDDVEKLDVEAFMEAHLDVLLNGVEAKR